MRHITRRNVSNLTKVAELAVAAPQVIAMRTAQMIAAGSTPSARDRAEFSLMSSEKAAAFGESMMGMGRQLARTQQEYTRSVVTRLIRMWMTPWWLQAYRPVTQSLSSVPAPLRLLLPTSSQQQRAVSQLVAKAVAPVHQAATANARRLIAKAAAPARKRVAAAKGKRVAAKGAAPARKRATTKTKGLRRVAKRAR